MSSMVWARMRRAVLYVCLAQASLALAVQADSHDSLQSNATTPDSPAISVNPTSSPADRLSVIDQATIDAAMARMRDRQQQRKTDPPSAARYNPDEIAHGPSSSTTNPTPDAPPASASENPQPSTVTPGLPDPAVYTREFATARKLELVRAYDEQLTRARQALRRRMLSADEVRDLLGEQSALVRLPIDRFRDLLLDADTRNAQRVIRYRDGFGELNTAARTVVTILMKAGMVDSALPLPDDPLSEELEQAHGVRRVYFQFFLPARDGSTQQRRHNGYVEFQLSLSQGLWVPTWADLEGEPLPLFDARAFAPLRPYRIVFDANAHAFVVAQEQPLRDPPVFSLLGPTPGETFGRLPRRVAADGFFASPARNDRVDR